MEKITINADVCVQNTQIYTYMYIAYRWFKAHGIVVPSEKRQRKLSSDLLGTNLTSELAPLSFPLKYGGEDFRPTPLVSVPDLVEEIFHLLDQNDRYKQNACNMLCILVLAVCTGSPTMGKSSPRRRFG